MTERYFEDFAVGQIFRPPAAARRQGRDLRLRPKIRSAALSPRRGGGAAVDLRAPVRQRLAHRRDDHEAHRPQRIRPAGGTIGLGFDDLRWPIPVLPGDELRIESEVLEMRPSQSRPDRGLVKVRTRTLNQNDDIVQELIANVMVPRRPGNATD